MMEVELIIGGSRRVPWTSISVERSLTALVGAFSATFPMTSGPIRPGLSAQLEIPADGPFGRETILNGYIDAVEGSSDARAREFSIAGRDRTADLVDGSHKGTPSGWTEASLLTIARDLVAPYGLRVEDFADSDTKIIHRLSPQPGESTFATLERASRQHGVLIGTSPRASVVLGTQLLGRAESTLRTGPRGNITSWRSSANHSERYHRTIVRGANDGGLGVLAGNVTRPYAEVIDDAIRGQREQLIIAQGQVDAEACERLAEWHVAVARARSSQISVNLPSWRQSSDGPLWRPGLAVPLELEELGLSGEMLVDAVQLRRSPQGEEATLSLIFPGSLDQDPSKRDDDGPNGLGELA